MLRRKVHRTHVETEVAYPLSTERCQPTVQTRRIPGALLGRRRSTSLVRLEWLVSDPRATSRRFPKRFEIVDQVLQGGRDLQTL